jgi:hypothetical protein
VTEDVAFPTATNFLCIILVLFPTLAVPYPSETVVLTLADVVGFSQLRVLMARCDCDVI